MYKEHDCHISAEDGCEVCKASFEEKNVDTAFDTIEEQHDFLFNAVMNLNNLK